MSLPLLSHLRSGDPHVTGAAAGVALNASLPLESDDSLTKGPQSQVRPCRKPSLGVALKGPQSMAGSSRNHLWALPSVRNCLSFSVGESQHGLAPSYLPPYPYPLGLLAPQRS